ncbi:MAG: beta-ketoacyl-ACP synthase II [Dehalococcoidia bacterium]|nr:beta-ketoacyl-ACP synthase II [Dehalococcoidia bacterium]
MSRRVVVTGIGMVTPVGLTAADSWDAIVNGRGGIGPITLFDPTGLDSQIAGEVKDFVPTDYMEKKVARRADRFAQFAFVAADEALREANFEIVPEVNDNVAVIVGTAIGGITTLSEEYETMLNKGVGRVSPFLIPMMLPDMASGQLSVEIGARGVNYCLVSACASGADCIGEAANIIRRGDLDVALAGGSEAAVTPITMAGFCAARSLSGCNDDPEHASRPFDNDRDGFVMAEGSAILVLNRGARERARRDNPCRDRRVRCDQRCLPCTQPDEHGRGAAGAMHNALRQAELRPDDIDYVNAHGTSTPMNDKLETVALKRVFGERAHELPISSSKSMTGHLLGAAGAVEAAICVRAMTHNIIPPTINYVTPDPSCDLDYVPNVARSAQLECVMTNSLGFGGHNASLASPALRGARMTAPAPSRPARRWRLRECRRRTCRASARSRQWWRRSWPRGASRHGRRRTCSTSRTWRPTTTRSNCPAWPRRLPACAGLLPSANWSRCSATSTWTA